MMVIVIYNLHFFYNFNIFFIILAFVNVCNKITNLNCFDLCHAVVSQICELCQLGQFYHPVSQKYDLYLYQMDQDLHNVQCLYVELMLKMVTNVLKLCSVPAKII